MNKRIGILCLLWAVMMPVFAQQISRESQERLMMQQRKLAFLLNVVENLYVDTVDIQSVTDDAIVSILEELDPHSAYIPKDEVQRANEALEGSFSGIGVQFQMLEDTLFVIQTISGCPAEKVGVFPGDRIVMVEDTVIAGVKMPTSAIMKRLRGPKGSTVRVKVKREGVEDLIEFAIVRDKIPINSLDAAYLVAPGIGYLKTNNFGATTLDEVHDAWKKLQKQGAKKMIVDLQGNGGGYLTAAIEMADDFLAKDRIIVYTQGEHQARSVAKSTERGIFETGPLIILVDEFSASASEIVSGAVQDWDRGVIIGRRTFGKGLVQRQMLMPDGSALRLTTARYYTPTGRCIQKPYKGVDYQKDLMERQQHGELMHADSIHFPDSLKYATLLNARTVYGGGGIMPDIFIPVDTNRYTDYHRNLMAKGVMNRFCVLYVDQHREELKRQYKRFEQYKEGFSVTDEMMDNLKAMGEKEKVEFDEKQFDQSKRLIRLQIKALIARDVWEDQCYYEIMNEENDALKKALEVLSTEGMYENALKRK